MPSTTVLAQSVIISKFTTLWRSDGQIIYLCFLEPRRTLLQVGLPATRTEAVGQSGIPGSPAVQGKPPGARADKQGRLGVFHLEGLGTLDPGTDPDSPEQDRQGSLEQWARCNQGQDQHMEVAVRNSFTGCNWTLPVGQNRI